MRRRRKPQSKAKQIRQLNDDLKQQLSQMDKIVRTAEEWKARAVQLKSKITELEQSTEIARRIIEKNITTDYRYANGPGSTYRITVEFDAKFMGRMHDNRETEYVAHNVASRIENEIIRSKFVTDARDTERDERNNRRRDDFSGRYFKGIREIEGT